MVFHAFLAKTLKIATLIRSRFKQSKHYNLQNFKVSPRLKTIVNKQNIIKSPNDKNLYKTFALENGLRVLLIHKYVPEDNKDNPSASDSEMGAAALCIGVGSFHDPPEIPGLAHFLEHMIFMGSQKYPKENHYHSFFAKHGGYDNAFVSDETTVFHIEIVPKHLKEALDIFASCFVSPLLNPDSCDREIESIDSEFQQCVPKDGIRVNSIYRSLAKPEHPMSKFDHGNKISLKYEPEKLNINVHEALRSFQEQYYSAHRMTLAVQSTETLETMEDWVTELFSALPNNGLPVVTIEDLKEPFETKSFHKFYKVVPVKTMNRMILTWALPAVGKHYKSKPLEYLSYFLQHEGTGSILAYLKERCWSIFQIKTEFRKTSTESVLFLKLELTELGMDHQFDVLTVIFQYLKMLRSNGPQEQYFEKLKTIEQTKFLLEKLLFKEDPGKNMAKLSEQMQLYPVEHYLCGDKLYFEYDPEIISECLDYLKPCNVNIMVLSSRYTEEDCQEVEKWTKCKYSCCDIPDEWLTSWKDIADNQELDLPKLNDYIDIADNQELDLPKLNDYIEKLEQINSGVVINKYPITIHDDEISCVWIKQEIVNGNVIEVTILLEEIHGRNEVSMPVAACAMCLIRTPEIGKSAEGAAMADLFVLLLVRSLEEHDDYPVPTAGLFKVVSMLEGFLIVITRFDDKLSMLLEIVLDHIIKFDPDEGTFQSMKDRLKTNSNNFKLDLETLAEELELSMLINAWTSAEKLNAVKSVTRPMLKEFVKRCFKTFFLESFFYGNLTKEKVLAMDKMIREKMNPHPLPSEQLLKKKAIELPDGTSVCRVASPIAVDQNTVVVNFYQLGPYNLESSCMISLLSNFMHQPCFDVLRTQEQLGYAVFCTYFTISGTSGLKIGVQSPSNKFSCVFIDERIDEFLKNYLKDLEELDQKKFETQRGSFVWCKKFTSEDTCEDLYLNEEHRCLWDEIKYQNYVFNRNEQEIKFLENLKFKDFKKWLSLESIHLLNKKKKLSTQVVGPSDEILAGMSKLNSVEISEKLDALRRKAAK